MSGMYVAIIGEDRIKFVVISVEYREYTVNKKIPAVCIDSANTALRGYHISDQIKAIILSEF